jgi:antitoxin (DNA-binding transcriptional repressor) of toxin-antitoxin stability system
MERAAGGAEISVSRHGRPYVRLVPAALNPSIPGADE